MRQSNRFLYLTLIYIKSVLHRIKSDLGREIVVALSGAVLLMLFFYIFNDFIHVKLDDLKSSSKSNIASTVSYTILICVSSGLLRWLKFSLIDQNELAYYAKRQGESSAQILAYRLLKFLIVTGLTYIFAWSAVLNFFVNWPFKKVIVVQGICLIPLLFAFIPASGNRSVKKHKPLIGSIEVGQKSKGLALFSWRLRQMISRNRAAYFSLFLALFTASLQYLAQSLGLPIFISIMISACAGLFIASAMAFQVQSDMENSWLDQSLGVSHRDIVQTYLYIGILLGLFFGIIHGLAVYAGNPSTSSLELIKILGVAALSPILFPSIMFQLDARRPSLQIMTIFFIALFIATAILAHWLSFLLIPLVYYYANNYQVDNYYRS